jgi:hypothetical protein
MRESFRQVAQAFERLDSGEIDRAIYVVRVRRESAHLVDDLGICPQNSDTTANGRE